MEYSNLASCLLEAKCPPVPGDPDWTEVLSQVVMESRKVPPWVRKFIRGRSNLKGKLMDIITSTAIIPLLCGCVGIFGLFKLLQRIRMKAYIQDSVVVITGATSGLGKECAKVFHAAGAKLVLCGRNRERLEELVRELTTNQPKKTHKPHIVTFDLADSNTVVQAAAEILKCVGYVDILINNAGISYRGTIIDTTVDVAILPSMIQKRQGHIVVISSIQGKISIPFRSAYAASKHATQAFFDCLRAEMEQYEIDVTVVSPGYIRTNLSLNAVTADGSRYGVMDKTTSEGRNAAEVAQEVLSAVGKKKKEVVVASLIPCLAVYLRTLSPRLFFKFMAGRARAERKSKAS
ncbi:dehydrogenase/reductase SDR family member 7B isoform X4 [Ornithorhynchus anatinus]|uniref:dehydrogenase/reductase SDR family member 7B isoform X4 n=1 Tax=Ornithorhynchus anatinus TaxID=9258 RepID=UPI0010A7B482|nr:dehydrogenase/reductase SDR family member 7B isoform X4 [Ornithorhynchus anatinus]